MSEPVTEIRPHEGVLLIAILKRTLDPASSERVADDVLTAAAERQGIPVVLDMSRVHFAPSSALGVLVRLSRSFKLDGRRLALVGVTRQVLDPIQVTNLHTIVEIHDTVEQVLRPQARNR